MERFTPEFENKEVTVSRREFAEISAMVANNLIDGLGDHITLGDRDYLRMLLTVFSADIMTELFTELEVEE